MFNFRIYDLVVIFHSLLEDVARKKHEVTGDGSTTAIVCTSLIYSEGIKNIDAACDSRVFFSKASTITTTTEIAQLPTIHVKTAISMSALVRSRCMCKEGQLRKRPQRRDVLEEDILPTYHSPLSDSHS